MAGRKRIYIISAAAAAAAVTAAACIFTYGETRPTADEINNASLIIGTYLIDFDALNEENQSLAEKNAEDTNQNRIYYKSDLNSGVWYDITDAENVNDITLSNNKIVDAKTINALELTLYFKADGTVVDLVNGGTVSVKDIESSLFPANIDACKTLSEQLNITNELVNSTSDYGKDDEKKAKYELYRAEQNALNAILAPVNDRTTADLTAKLKALESSNSEAAASLRVKLRGQLDKHCSEVVYARIEDQMSALGSPDKSSHANLISALADVQSSLLEDIGTLDSETSSGTGTAAQKQSKLEDELIDALTSGNTSAAEKAEEKLDVLEAMTNGKQTDPAAAAEMADELYNEAVSNIDALISSVENGTNDVYSDESATTSEDVKTALTTAIKEAQGYAKDRAYYTTGSTSSAEYNSIAADKLGQLGDRLAALSTGSGGDKLLNDLRQISADSSDELLSEAESAKALSDSSLAEERKKLDDIQKDIDSKYNEYIDAISSGSNSLADTKKAELNALTDKLAEMQSGFAAEAGGKYSALIDSLTDRLKNDGSETGSDSDSSDAIRKANAEKDALKTLLSETDSALLDSFDEALDNFISSAESGSSDGYSDLVEALKNVPESVMTNDDRAKVLSFAVEKLRDNGADDIAGQIAADISSAQNGGMSPSASADSSGSSGTTSGAQTAAKLNEKYSQLLEAKKKMLNNIGSEDAVKKLTYEKDGIKELLPSADKAAMDSFDSALDNFDSAAESGSTDGYDGLVNALKNVPADCMDNSTRAKALEYADAKLSACGLDSLADRIAADIISARNGGMTPSGGTVSAVDELYGYALVIPKYDIYSNSLSLTLDGTTYINAREIAELIGAQYISADGVFVIKGNNILIEFTVGSSTAYVGDKLLMTDAAPKQIGSAEYISPQLLAAGLGLTGQTENGTLFIR